MTQANLPTAAPDYVKVLEELGFLEADDHGIDERTWASLNQGGEYRVHSTHIKGDMKVLCEQNSHPDAPGSETVVTYPKVLVVESPKGRVAVRPVDTEALRDAIQQLS